jgi:hypothetical protein
MEGYQECHFQQFELKKQQLNPIFTYFQVPKIEFGPRDWMSLSFQLINFAFES